MEDCANRDVRKAGEEEDWKNKTRDRGGWKILYGEAVKKLRAAPHPDKGKTRKREYLRYMFYQAFGIILNYFRRYG